MKEFLEKYWEDIVDIIDKIYFAFKKYILGEDAE